MLSIELLFARMASNNTVTVHEIATLKVELTAFINTVLLADRLWLRNQFNEICKAAQLDKKIDQSRLQKFLKRLQVSHKVVCQRTQQCIDISYPQDLPVSQMREQIKSALENHQVIIIAGETGSGKTTQIPKMCLELGRGIIGRIGHTQPRRIAARAVATRIADELNVVLGSTVGFQFRFSSHSSDHNNVETRVKVMTDGILLAEVPSDRQLLAYDTLIIDEAHERSLNIDFLLGYLKKLLPERPDLKIIITSATIDVQRFAEYFDNAPVIAVEGRSFPVQIEYLENVDAESIENNLEQSNNQVKSDEQVDGNELAKRVRYALDVLEADNGIELSRPRDVLVFLPGEREIRDVSNVLRKAQERYDILPLYARLSAKEQQRVFSPDKIKHATLRRIILATNVAETSITVPGIGYVIDSGLVRLSRYSAKSKIQRLPIEPISQASARQRAGRCGRIAPGICYRLYSESDHDSRSAFTEPEILRTQLAAVILQMKRLGLGEIEHFPFIQQPEQRQVRSGLNTLVELGAIDTEGRLSSMGRKLSTLPIDPRLGRMLLAGIEKSCIAEVLVIVSALAVQDPRDFPADKRPLAESMHKRFWDSRSDFLMWLNLWIYTQSKRDSLSQSQWRKRCKTEFLSYLRLREWRDIHRQLLLSIKPLLKQEIKNRVNKKRKVDRSDSSLAERFLALPDYELLKRVDNSSNKVTDKSANQAVDLDGHNRRFPRTIYEYIHRALLTGIPLQVGNKSGSKKGSKKSASQRNVYTSVRNLQFYLFPGSSQFKKTPAWILAGEIVETQKVYARSLAAIDPEWIVKELPHLLKHSYAEPTWHSKRGQVFVSRSSHLYGLQLVANQSVAFDRVDKRMARELFIKIALVQQQLNPDEKLTAKAEFWRHNCQLIDTVRVLEEKLRRRDLVLDETALFNFYDDLIPAWVLSRATLWQWLNTKDCDQKKLLLREGDVLLDSHVLEKLDQFPEKLIYKDQSYMLQYCFCPGAENDGVTAIIPLSVIASLPIYIFDWLVPGMLLDKCIDMLKALPKSQRKKLVPIPAVAKQLLDKIDVTKSMQSNTPLAEMLSDQIRIHYNIQIDAILWRAESEKVLDNYCRMRFEIIDASNTVLLNGRAIHQLQRDCLQHIDEHIATASNNEFGRQSIHSWDFGSDLRLNPVISGDGSVAGYPALLDAGDAVELSLVATECLSEAKSRDGVLRLAMLESKDRTRFLKKQLRKITVPVLPYINVGNHKDLVDDVIMAAIDDSCFNHFREGVPRSESEFSAALASGASKVVSSATHIEQLLHEILKKYQVCCEQLQQNKVHFAIQCEDVQIQLKRLVFPGFLRQTGKNQLQHLPRYLQAIAVRFDRLGGSVEKDNEYSKKLSSLNEMLQSLLYRYPEAIIHDQDVIHFRWLLEELRVSLFAQQLKTAVPVSFQRVSKAWNVINHNQYPLLS